VLAEVVAITKGFRSCLQRAVLLHIYIIDNEILNWIDMIWYDTKQFDILWFNEMYWILK
jgi:hypothetical protein